MLLELVSMIPVGFIPTIAALYLVAMGMWLGVAVGFASKFWLTLKQTILFNRAIYEFFFVGLWAAAVGFPTSIITILWLQLPLWFLLLYILTSIVIIMICIGSMFFIDELNMKLRRR